MLCNFVLVISQAINKFACARHPGIYKQDYIDALYMFYNEKKPEDLVCPQTPEWKRISDPDFCGVKGGNHKYPGLNLVSLSRDKILC